MLTSIVLIVFMVVWLSVSVWNVVHAREVSALTYFCAVLAWCLAVLPSVVKGFQ